MTTGQLRTPPLKADADPTRAAEYAASLDEALRSSGGYKAINAVHEQYADIREDRSLWREVQGLVHAPKGSAEAKARDKLGIFLILFGIFGAAILFWVILAIGGLLFG
jgi:hypothetical protein